MPRPGTPLIHPKLLERLRPVDEEAQVDECLITRAATKATFDAATGTRTAGTTTTVFEGPTRCSGRPQSLSERVVDVGDEGVTVRAYTAVIPYDAPEVKINDRYTLTVGTDPRLVGRPLRVVDVIAGSFTTGRLLTVVDES